MRSSPFPLALPAIVSGTIFGAAPALAHPGDHAHFGFWDTLAHLTEPDHLALAALGGLVGYIAYRALRRDAASAHTREDRTRRDEEPKP